MAKQTDNQVSAVRRAKHGWILTLFFSILAVFYLYPIFLVLINSLKKKGFIMKSPFALPDERSFFGMTNFVKGIEKTNFFAAFGNSVIITVGSVAVIIFCTSMCAWFITRVHNKFTMALYMLCLFSMIVPFQMVMFPLSKLANMMHFVRDRGGRHDRWLYTDPDLLPGRIPNHETDGYHGCNLTGNVDLE